MADTAQPFTKLSYKKSKGSDKANDNGDPMFHMLTCFNLKAGEEIEDFREALAALTLHLKERGLAEGHGPVGLRQSDTILDTDEERDHRYFVTMFFRDRAQADAAVEYIQAQTEPGNALHRATWAGLQDPVFICWQDI